MYQLLALLCERLSVLHTGPQFQWWFPAVRAVTGFLFLLISASLILQLYPRLVMTDALLHDLVISFLLCH